MPEQLPQNVSYVVFPFLGAIGYERSTKEIVLFDEGGLNLPVSAVRHFPILMPIFCPVLGIWIVADQVGL